MTVQSLTNRTDSIADGVQTVFPYDYLLLEASHMTVFLDGVSTPTGWTVDGVGNPTGGNVTFAVPPADGVQVTRLRDVPLTQEVDYIEGDRFPAETHEKALDLGVMRDQQQVETEDRSLKYGIDTDVLPAETVLPEPEPSKAIGYDATGKLTNVVIGVGGSPVVNPLQEDLLSGGNSFVAQDGVGGNTVAKMDAAGIVEATEFTRQGQNLDLRYADRAVALAHYADGEIHFPDTAETDPQVRVAGGWLPLPESATVTVSDTPPSSPVNGDLWLQSSTGRLAAWYDDGSSQQWVEVGPGAVGSVKSGEHIVSDISLDGLATADWTMESGFDYRIELLNFYPLSGGGSQVLVGELSVDGVAWPDNQWASGRDGALNNTNYAASPSNDRLFLTGTNPYISGGTPHNVDLKLVNADDAARNTFAKLEWFGYSNVGAAMSMVGRGAEMTARQTLFGRARWIVPTTFTGGARMRVWRKSRAL